MPSLFRPNPNHMKITYRYIFPLLLTAIPMAESHAEVILNFDTTAQTFRWSGSATLVDSLIVSGGARDMVIGTSNVDIGSSSYSTTSITSRGLVIDVTPTNLTAFIETPQFYVSLSTDALFENLTYIYNPTSSDEFFTLSIFGDNTAYSYANANSYFKSVAAASNGRSLYFQAVGPGYPNLATAGHISVTPIPENASSALSIGVLVLVSAGGRRLLRRQAARSQLA